MKIHPLRTTKDFVPDCVRRALKARYDEVLQEPLPPRVKSMIDEIRKAEKKSS